MTFLQIKNMLNIGSYTISNIGYYFVLLKFGQLFPLQPFLIKQQIIKFLFSVMQWFTKYESVIILVFSWLYILLLHNTCTSITVYWLVLDVSRPILHPRPMHMSESFNSTCQYCLDNQSQVLPHHTHHSHQGGCTRLLWALCGFTVGFIDKRLR